MRNSLSFILLIILAGCIGTDVLDDEIRPPLLTIAGEDNTIALLVGEDLQLQVNYLNEYGVSENISPSWQVDYDSVASVSENGIVTARSSGQTTIYATYRESMSPPIMVNVSGSAHEVSRVVISTPKAIVEIGEPLQLTATGYNLLDEEIAPATPIMWSVDTDEIATISDSGLLEGIREGEVEVTATMDGITSQPLIIQVGSATLSAPFMGSGGYHAQGTALLSRQNNGDIVLTLSDDFETDFALGTFIYLSNSTSGSATKSAGLELGEITTNGAAEFNVTVIASTTTLSSYRYVIVLCKPAAVTFGLADFNP